VKRFLDSLAYYFLIGDTAGIETDYKKVMHTKREVPMSSCPSFVENMLYSTGGTTSAADKEECAGFRVMVDELDAKAEKYETQKAIKQRRESLFHKYYRLGIHGTWCRVDTDGVFEYNGHKYEIDKEAIQYQPIETDIGQLYDMDRILVTGTGDFYDMKYDQVKAREI